MREVIECDITNCPFLFPTRSRGSGTQAQNNFSEWFVDCNLIKYNIKRSKKLMQQLAAVTLLAYELSSLIFQNDGI
jgi:hypothetical protein